MLGGVNMGPVVMVAMVVLVVAMLIAFPSAFGAYYARCFGIKISRAMLLVFLPAIAMLLVATYPPLMPLLPFALAVNAIVVVAAVAQQLRGRCALDKLASK